MRSATSTLPPSGAPATEIDIRLVTIRSRMVTRSSSLPTIANQKSISLVDMQMEAKMLLNLDPVLTGRLLLALDEMGHGDAVVIADAHFTASKLARKHLIDFPGLSSPRVLAAIRTVMVPDTFPALDLMESPDGLLPVQTELIAAAGLDPEETRMVERFAFYDLARDAELIIRTGETRTYGNALFRKGVTPVMPA